MDLTVVNLRTELPAMDHRLGYRENSIEPFPAESKLLCPQVADDEASPRASRTRLASELPGGRRPSLAD
jgi:hypothetical protein